MRNKKKNRYDMYRVTVIATIIYLVLILLLMTFFGPSNKSFYGSAPRNIERVLSDDEVEVLERFAGSFYSADERKE